MIGFILLGYAVLIGWLVLSKQPPRETTARDNTESVSVVIAYRNEVGNLPQLIKEIGAQSIAKSDFELILVNDHSNDGSSEVVKKAIERSELAIRHFDLKEKQGKKAAITLGVMKAKFDIILCTDADCGLNPRWMETMLQSFENKETKMVLAAVQLTGSKGWFQKLQAVEFSSLMAITLLTTRRNRPIISNGANYAFRKTAFEISEAYVGNSAINTGDDVFLLHSFKRKFGKECVVFSEKENSVVRTKVKKTYSSFLNQRIRWASKSKSYKDFDTVKMGGIIFLANLAVLGVFVGALFQYFSLEFFLGCFLFKWILDLLLLQQLPLFLRPKSIVKGTFLLSMLYPFYSVGIALLSLFHRPQWKGRKI